MTPRSARPPPPSGAASASSSASSTGPGTSRRRSSPTPRATVVVVGTRDCTLQRRYQKLVEEAPAPFLTEAQLAAIYDASKAICKEAGYVGAGTCEFLVAADGLISFLEVNTRLQVEHPVTEEVSGFDLVRWQFAIADGASLAGIEDPKPRGHSFEFRINGEDAGRGFLPAPGTVTRFDVPLGPGVRVDTGGRTPARSSAASSTRCWPRSSSPATPASRRSSAPAGCSTRPSSRAWRRCCRSTASWSATPTSPPSLSTCTTAGSRTEWDNTVEPFAGGADAAEPDLRQKVTVEVGGRRLEVVLPEGLGGGGGGSKKAAPRRSAKSGGGAAASGDSLTAPMQGTIVKVAVEDGATVAVGELILVLEAMKMENPVTAHKAGVVSGLTAAAGEVVTSGTVLATIKDADA